MSRTGLRKFGVMAPTVVREPTRDRDNIPICPECGHPVPKTKGSQRIEKPDLVNVVLAASFDEIVTFGWCCDRHPYDIVLPMRAGGPEAGALIDGWTGVKLRFSDEHVRHVPVPEREVSEHVE
ncbi:hypothetical protein C482_12974 [Natrialba chahannaoensis JCM 10990]|uniref:Uncharacterized protein n=1 Tax=Natrialba chahannaoensis JCM 10990 TaxID=1227492 RepID=M0AGR3_9EURY|nr:hypothetical protein [Natrialba chahannaoensis]ELY97536.1 hypothetical protein C482_12974 [Natrialba chahannaoensis JCM 10990]